MNILQLYMILVLVTSHTCRGDFLYIRCRHVRLYRVVQKAFCHLERRLLPFFLQMAVATAIFPLQSHVAKVT